MKNALPIGLLLVCLGTAEVVALSIATIGSSVHSQGTEAWEYGYLAHVASVESYEIDIRSWAASREDKDYLRTHIFSYETGLSKYDLRLNKLKRMNGLAEEGWELYDEQSGLLRRRR